MRGITFNQPLKQIMFLQAFGANPWAYSSFATTITGGHIGIDVSFGDGDPIRAVSDGEIVYVSQDTIVQLCKLGSDWFEIVYGHGRDCKVSVGDIVNSGTELASQGYEGPSVMYKSDTPEIEKLSWSHLHFGIRPVIIGERDNGSFHPWNFAGFSNTPYRYKNDKFDVDDFIDPAPFFEKVIYKIADAIIKKEDMRKYHAKDNNPGAIRSAKGPFLKFPSYQEGYDYLVDYLKRACIGTHKAYRKGMTIREFFSVYSPSNDGNDPLKYARDVVAWVGLRSIDDPISDWLLTEIEWIRKYNCYEWSYPEQVVANQVRPGDTQVKIQNEISIMKILKAIWNLITRDKGRN